MSGSGGNSGFGGDFLWRWGNDEAHRQGTLTDQQLYQQHNPTWIPAGYPDAGKILVFNNMAEYDFNGQPSYSQFHIIDPEVSAGNYNLNVDGTFGPMDFEFTMSGADFDIDYWTKIQGGVQLQANGNFLSCLGGSGKFIETTREGEVLWVYQSPVYLEPVEQFHNLIGSFRAFRSERYPPDHPAFVGRNLQPTGIIENINSISEACYIETPVIDLAQRSAKIFPNPATDFINITFEEPITIDEVSLYDLQGRLIRNFSLSAKRLESIEINLAGLTVGVYLLQINAAAGVGNHRIVKQ